MSLILLLLQLFLKPARPLKNVIKDFMGYRFTETGSMAETVEKLKKIMNLEKPQKMRRC